MTNLTKIEEMIGMTITACVIILSLLLLSPFIFLYLGARALGSAIRDLI